MMFSVIAIFFFLSAKRLQLLALAAAVSCPFPLHARASAVGCYSAIFNIGDSISDSGNSMHLQDSHMLVSHPPYGQTFFGHPSGRFSDGRIVVDFIADAMGLPSPTPYLVGRSVDDFRYGANLAVGGATALNRSSLESETVDLYGTDHSLDVQIRWLKQLLESMSSSYDQSSKDILSSSLVIVGIGVNDYRRILIARTRQRTKLRPYVPAVVGKIATGISELIEMGAKTLLVTGSFPTGCSPDVLTYIKSMKARDYDPKTGCHRLWNDFAKYHKAMLKRELEVIRHLQPHVLVSFADYFEASMAIIKNPEANGFKPTLVACCGGDGPYNYDALVLCGSEGSNVCPDPSKLFSWDGVHSTEAAYEFMARGLVSGVHADPPFATACPHLLQSAAQI